MKKVLSMLLTAMLLLTCVFTGAFGLQASAKVDASRAIAIVFDNSGSMYVGNNNKAWCRATYAMEVFASMLNSGDTLMIYPMHTIEVGGKQYTMNDPYRITEASQASTIREIYTPEASGTPFESVDCAARGLQDVQADEKHLIVLTDGAFDEMDMKKTAKTLSSYTEKFMTVMYLGIGYSAALDSSAQTDSFIIKQADNSSEVLSSLTAMCNRIFGRDALPQNRISGNTIEFDISMSKLIVFVQGENVSGLKVVGPNGPVGTKLSEASTKYGTAGSNRGQEVDPFLQGMMVTYTDCPAGTYTIDYAGTATSIEVYYEPNADLDFVFTGVHGDTVDPDALYEGDYKVSFGMKDARTNKLISSDLLGSPHYEGSYYINGQEHSIIHDGYSGEVPVSLKLGDTFKATLTVTYLSGYTITKDTSDFGWPKDGIQVSVQAVRDLKLEITGGASICSLPQLQESEPYIAKVYYGGKQLTGEELKKVTLKWDPDAGNAAIKQEFADDHYKLSLDYKDPASPQNTVCGKCKVDILAFYTAEASDETQTQATLTYNIKEDPSLLQLKLIVPEDYIVISELGESQTIIAKLLLNGRPLTAEEFRSVSLQAESKIKHEVTKNEHESCYEIRLLPTEGIGEGKCTITASAQYTDRIGRAVEAEASWDITLSRTPLWVKWTGGLLFLLLLIVAIWLILHIRTFPRHISTSRDCTMVYDGEDVTGDAYFRVRREGRRMTVFANYADTNVGLRMEVVPGKESYLYKSTKKRSISVRSTTVNVYGSETIQDASFDYAVIYEQGETGNLERLDGDVGSFTMTNGGMIEYSGVMLNKPFSTNIVLDYKKK